MSPAGDADLLVAARSALLDALAALAAHRDALVLIGAQAIYLHTDAGAVALAETTKDSDLAVDPRELHDAPLLDDAMQEAGFRLDTTHPQPGSWISPVGIPVDLMVPTALAGDRGRRGARIPPHSIHATRRTNGLEAAVIDHAPMTITALDPVDHRQATINVAGPAALLISKLHKLGERRDDPGRLLDKDAHDIYRLLVTADTRQLAARLDTLARDDLAGDATRTAITHLQDLFASTGDRFGATMAGRAEELVGDPAVVTAASTALADELVVACGANAKQD
jgi:hypothetical protein